MRSFFERINEAFSGFMAGRNGSDALSVAALIAAFIVVLVNTFIPNLIFAILGYALLFYSIFRVLSRNTSARTQENERFLSLISRGKRNAKTTKKSATSNTKAPKKSASKAAAPDRVTFTCEKCGQSLSVPKGRGTLKVTCPTCHHQTTIKS